MKAQTKLVQEGAKERTLVSEPPIAHWLFSSTYSAPLWTVLRIWLGLQWLASGWGKAMLWDFDKGGWLHNGGASLKSFWERILAIPPGGKGAVITYDWYYNFLNGLYQGGHYEWFAWLVALGEMAVGLGLIFGLFTGIAAFFGSLLNFSFELAGTASTNPVMFGVSVLIILAWRNAGWWGLDRFVLPVVGTPWQRGSLFRSKTGSDETPMAKPVS